MGRRAAPEPHQRRRQSGGAPVTEAPWEVIESELAHRNKALVRNRENSLPKYLESPVGRVPERPSWSSSIQSTITALSGTE